MSSTESPVVAPHPSLPRYYDESQGGKRPFVRKIFNSAAPDYNRIENLMALGWGPWYRRHALTHAGLARDMKVLDVAIGTGLVAREEITLTGDARNVVGLDPSVGMITEARRALPLRAILGVAEELPLANDSFDFL